MTPARVLTATILILCLVLSLCACAQVPPATEPTDNTDPSTVPSTTPSEPTAGPTTPSTEPPPSPELLYYSAQNYVDHLTELAMEYTVEATKVFGRDTYREFYDGTAFYVDLGSDNMEALIIENFTSGGYTTQYYESYRNGSGWSRVNNSSFRCPMTIENFLGRQIPAFLLEQSLYTSLDAQRTSYGFLLTFSGADQLESWVITTTEATMISASGTLELDAQGNLLSGTYHAEYMLGDTPYTLDVSVDITQTEAVDFTTLQPVYPENAPTVENLEILKYLLRTVGSVYAAPNMSVDCTDTVKSQAMGQTRQQTSGYHLFGGSENLMDGLNTQVTVTDSIGNTSSNRQNGVFRDGQYTYSYNGGSTMTDASITSEKIRTALEDSILSALITPSYISNAQITDYGQQLVINFDGNDQLADSLCRNIYSLFKVDLDAFAESFSQGHITAHLTIDKSTGLPVAMGISLSRSHTIKGVTYQLSYELSQTISFSAAKSYESITGEPYIAE